MRIERKRTTVACLLCAAALVVTGASAAIFSPQDLTACASTEETTDCVKVFIGDINNAPNDYVQKRATYIDDTAAKKVTAPMEAVIGLDDYYTVKEVAALADDYGITINRAYMWPKGETGRLALYVENGDIEASTLLH